MSKPTFVELTPIEYQVSKQRQRARLITYYGFKFDTDLNQQIIQLIIEHMKHEKKLSVMTNPENRLIWQCEGKPLIAIDKEENKMYTTQGTIKYFGTKLCRSQAATVLQILRRYGYCNFTAYVIPLEPWRLGRNKKERMLTYEALEDLAKLASRKHIVIKEHKSAWLIGKQFHAQRNYIQNRLSLNTDTTEKEDKSFMDYVMEKDKHEST